MPAIAVLVAVADQVTKVFVRLTLAPSESVAVVDRILYLTHVRNPGAAFGLLPDRQSLFFAATGGVIAAIVAYYLRARPTDRVLVAALGLELGGAVGNLIDRSIWGKVTDFIDFRWWPVFNVADSAIVAGVLLLGLALVMRGRERGDAREEAS